MNRAFSRGFHTSRVSRGLNSVYILSGARTPIGNFNGALKSFSAPQLGVVAASEAVNRAGIQKKDVQELYFGQVIQADSGQAPARQVIINGGFPQETEATTVNKLCASGLKSVSLAAQAIQVGDRDVVMAGGMESMSNSPYYLPRQLGFGHKQATDSLIRDGLWDVYNDIHMGNCCENTNKRESITREQQDEYATQSYKKALETQKNGGFDNEIVPVTVKTRKGEVVVKDDEGPKGTDFSKFSTLRPAFEKNGTVTAANASSLNDGAAALVLASGAKAKELGANISAKIIAYADAATAPIDFTIAPSLAIPILLKRAGLSKDDIAKWEINEAFAGVSIVNNRLLGLDSSRVNVKGGAVALGHPIGASGARILVTLMNNLKEGEYGVAAICNGGGAATSLLIQKVSSVDDSEVRAKM